MDDVAQVEINGTDYYVPIDYIDYLVVIDGHLVNMGTQTITLYHTIRESGNNNSGYPRINCPSLQMATYQSSQGIQTTTLTVNSYEIKSRVTPVNTILLIVILCAMIITWFKGR